MKSFKLFLYLVTAALLLFFLVDWLRRPTASRQPEENLNNQAVVLVVENEEEPLATTLDPTPEIDRIEELFTLQPTKLPIVETITYTSKASWKKGGPAWLSDYAGHFKTSRHFIARSLNGKLDYDKQDVKEGDRFNVLRTDKKLQFYLILDVSRLKLWLYYLDLDLNEHELLKVYPVASGRVDPSRPSGFLTPFGKYTLGDRVALYQPGITGHHQGVKREMIQIFGTRWIPFEKEIGECTAPAKGYGIHGSPWLEDPVTHTLIEDQSSIGQYTSDGCVRLKQKDMEELFAIIISRPTTIEIVKDFHLASIWNKGE